MKTRSYISVYLCALLVAILCIGGIATLFLLSNKWMGIGLTAAGIGLLMVFVILLVSRLKRDEGETQKSIAQLARFASGDIGNRSIGKCSPSLQRLCKAIDAMPSLAEDGPKDLNVPIRVFKDALKKEIARHVTVRGIVLVIQLPPQKGDAFADTKEKTLALFSPRLFAEGTHRYYLYLDAAMCKEELRGRMISFSEAYQQAVKLAAAIYPEIAFDDLFVRLEELLQQGENVTISSAPETHLLPDMTSTLKRRRAIPFEAFERSDVAEADVLTLFHQSGIDRLFDGYVMAIYEKSMSSYRILTSFDASSETPLWNERRRLNQEEVDPLLQLQVNDEVAFVSDTNYLPQVARVEGRRCIAIASFDELGFALLHRREPGCPPNYAEVTALMRFYNAGRLYLSRERILLEKQSCHRRLYGLENISHRHLYEVDKQTNALLYLSPRLQEAFPQARLGHLCYKTLFGLDEPCRDCPLHGGAGFSRILLPLGSARYSIELLSNGAPALLGLHKSNANRSSTCYDRESGLLNRACFDEDFTGAMLHYRFGDVVFIRFNPAQMLLLLNALSLNELNENLYRYSPDTIVLLFLNEEKQKGEAFAAKIESIIRRSEYQISAKTSLYFFPVEAKSTYEFDLLNEKVFLN